MALTFTSPPPAPPVLSRNTLSKGHTCFQTLCSPQVHELSRRTTLGLSIHSPSNRSAPLLNTAIQSLLSSLYCNKSHKSFLFCFWLRSGKTLQLGLCWRAALLLTAYSPICHGYPIGPRMHKRYVTSCLMTKW